jgi:hypothetical protein
VINFVHHFWPDLLKTPGFLTEFITPIVKVSVFYASHLVKLLISTAPVAHFTFSSL